MSKKWGGQPGAVPDNVFGPDARVWKDGELVAVADATTGLLTHTLHYGFGLFCLWFVGIFFPAVLNGLHCLTLKAAQRRFDQMEILSFAIQATLEL